MTTRCTATLCSLLVLALSAPVYAQEEGGAEPAPEEAVPGAEDLPPEPEAPPPDIELDPQQTPEATTTPDQAPVVTTGPRDVKSTQTWKDIVVIPRKPFLKRGRVELTPYFGLTLNDPLIQHYALGGEINYALTDILAIGVSGHYYFKDILDQEFYTRYHFRLVPSINKYKYTVTLNFSYVPIYGKFSLFNSKILHYEVFATAGVGGSGTEIIPRDYRYQAFSNPFNLTFPVGLGGRLFLTRWMAVHATFRSYIMLDKFEPSQRGGGATAEEELEIAKDNAKTDIVNNMMFNIGVSFFFPMDFKYTTFR